MPMLFLTALLGVVRQRQIEVPLSFQCIEQIQSNVGKSKIQCKNKREGIFCVFSKRILLWKQGFSTVISVVISAVIEK